MRTLKNVLIGCGLFLLAIVFDLHTRREEMSAHAQKAWTYFFIGVFAIGIISLLQGCAHHVLVTTPIRVLTDSSYAGMTRCDSTGKVAIYLSPQLSERDRKYVKIHEEVHVEQSKRFTSCARFVRFYRSDPNVRWAIEAEAYCYEYMQKVKDGVNTQGDWQWLIYGMRLYDQRLSIWEVAQYLPCEEAPHDYHDRGLLPELPP